MKKLISSIVLGLTLATTGHSALLAGLSGSTLFLAPIIPTLVVDLAINKTLDGLGKNENRLLQVAASYGLFVILDEQSGTIEVIEETDDLNTMVNVYGMNSAEAQLVDANSEELNAAVNASLQVLPQNPTEQEVQNVWNSQFDFIGGVEVNNAYQKFGKLKAKFLTQSL